MTIYYVNATGGDDAKDGESEANAWQTWDYVRVQLYSAGDTIKFKRGETWTDNNYWTFTDSGSAESYITIDAYGTGTLPIFDNEREMVAKTWADEGGNVWSTAWTVGVYRCRIDGQDSYTTGANGDIDGTTYLWAYEGGATDKLFVYATEDPSTAYTSIKIASHNNYVFYLNGCNYVKIQNVRIHGGYYGIRFSSTGDETYIEINNCDLWYSYCPIYCPKTAGGGGTANYITVDTCDIDSKVNLVATTGIDEGERCIFDGIYAYNECNNWTITDCTITDWGHNGIAMLAQASSSQGVNNNVAENNTFDGSNSPYMRAISFSGIDGKCSSNIFRYNIDKNTTIRNQIGGDDSEFYYNLIYDKVDTGVADKSDRSQGILIDKIEVGMVCTGAKVYNNVFYNTYNQGIYLDATGVCHIKNNIVSESDASGNYTNTALVWIDTEAHEIYNNCFYDSNTSDVIWVEDDSSYHTVAEAEAAHSELSGNVSSDPTMTNPGSADFTLQITSPCLNTGTDVSLSTDYAGNSVLALPDIGAYEHQGVEAAPGQNGLHLSMGMGL